MMHEWLILMIGVEWKGNGRHGFSAEATVEGGGYIMYGGIVR
jgi:hypothetical protein